jgi:single-strand DNA-binding protein
MFNSYQRFECIGRVGSDPKIGETKDGRKAANFSIATSDVWFDKSSGEKMERTTWHTIVVFNQRLVEKALPHVKKGSLVHAVGQIKDRKYTDKNGIEREVKECVLDFTGEITILSTSGKSGGSQDSEEDGANVQTRGETGGSGDFSDDIPF